MTALAFALAVALSGAPASAVNGKTAFEQLKKLEGNWKTGEKDAQNFITFRVVAGGAAVLETVTGADRSTITEMTTFHLDGGELVVTHFSAGNATALKVAGSAPRALKLEAAKKGGAQSLAFLQKDADNLTREWSPGGKDKTSLELKREYVDTLK